MKLTKEVLKQIIKEEIQAVLSEATVDRTNKTDVRRAAKEIMKAEFITDKSMLSGLMSAIKAGAKTFKVYGPDDKEKTIDLMKYISYSK